MATLTENTYVEHPKTGEPVAMFAGQKIPDWALEHDEDTPALIGDHLIAEVQSAASPTGDSTLPANDEMPPTSGRGSGVEAWAGYAAAKGITYPEGANRDEIIAAVQAHHAGL